MLVNDDVVKDSQPIYCKTLGVVGNVLGSAADKYSSVQSVTTTLADDGRTRFCDLNGGRGSSSASIEDGSVVYSARNFAGLQWTLIAVLAAGLLAVILFVVMVVFKNRRGERRQQEELTPRTDFASMMKLYPRKDEEDPNDNNSLASFSEVWKSRSED